MKKLLLVGLLTLLHVLVKAQTSGAVITTVPATFTALDQVKVIVDVSNVPNLRGQSPLYVWTWNPREPNPGNGSWDNSNEAMKMVQEGPDKWSWTFVPYEFYDRPAGSLTPGSITQIQFLVKAKNGNGDKKTDDITLKVAPLVYTPTDFRTFPSVVGQNEVITVFLNQILTPDLTTKRMNPTQAEVKLYAGNTQVGATKTFTVTTSGNKEYSFTTIPRADFVIPAGVMVTKMTVMYKGTLPDATGANATVTSPVFEKLFDDLK